MSSALHMLFSSVRMTQSLRPTVMPGGMPGSERMKISMSSVGFGSCARNVKLRVWPTRILTCLYAVRTPVVSVMVRQLSLKGVVVPVGSVTNTGGAAIRMRKQRISEAWSPLLWSRCQCLTSSPLGSVSPTQRLVMLRTLSYARAQMT